MKPVAQTRTGRGDGDCLRAAVASLLEVEIDDVVDAVHVGGPWMVNLNRYLAARGLGAFEIAIRPGISFVPDGLLCVGTGPSSRGQQHAVVVRTVASYTPVSETPCESVVEMELDFEFVHDPHPSGDFVKRVDSIIVLAPLDVAHKGARA